MRKQEFAKKRCPEIVVKWME